MPAEIPLQNAAVLGSIEDRAPGFELTHPVRRFLRVELRHPPIIDVLTAAHRVGEMDFPVVAIVDVGQRCGDSALRHHGVRFAQQRFANHPDRDARPQTLRSRRADQRRPHR